MTWRRTVGTSTGSEAATGCFVTLRTPIDELSSLATRGPTCPLVRWRRSTAKPGWSILAGGEEAAVRYTVIYEQGDTSWGAYVPDLPGCAAVGASREEVEELIGEAIAAYLEDLREAGQPVPPPRSSVGLIDVA